MELLPLLAAHRVLGIIRARDAAAAVAAGRVLVDAGLPLLEVSLITPDAADAIAELAGIPGAIVGAGTVLSPEDVALVEDAGASFIVTPAITDAVPVAAGHGLPVLAGATTATEALTAMQLGATAVKLFPASIGGPSYLKALRDPLPGLPFVPVGGVDAAAAREYLRVGAVAVGVGSPLLGDAVAGGSLDELAERAASFAALAAEFA
ncbi:bifunctional 4-hydroxy-2-oxoglutarate aldolase/2-dehydro-3-deoxy-phosphogluconate aldolase [Propioniciclava coleopterorum]|uniref:Bifunctional 4-hydroxy-2-oxoglutarate aldolase/2-dehydro-3-deoxy-phosphogluconate aldolase n=1 Tax=Propioniciclava coleopterorum TaxID=2714937 RepID=A0A6G7YAK5_9ACTN|nr:bifunctional 4-hydroxy-2-oxoglutarate aldolase/2-dehydro-3-deoxy-phosphogluconate aldolase [Propioniciclava coleopterorum]